MRRLASRIWARLGVSGVLLLAILALALGLRLAGIAWGLPYSFVNADESTVLPKAFAVANGHPNPQFFLYPSLYFYLVAALYLVAAPFWWALGHGNLLAKTSFVVDPGPYFLLARLLSAAMGTAAVYLVWRLGRASFGRAAGLASALLLAVVPLFVAYSHMGVTDMTATTLSLLALVLLQRAADGGGRRWLVWGAVAAGLATSTKYNLGMLAIPATVAAVYACRKEVAGRVRAGARATTSWLRLVALRVYLPMLLAFVLGSPFVVIDAPHFVRDFIRQGRVMDRGWLGFEHTGNGFWFNLSTNLGGALGLVLLVLALAGLGWALWRRTRFDLLAAPYVIVYFLYVSTWKELADRYLLPVIPLLVILAVRLVVELAVLRPKAKKWTVPVAVALLAAAAVAPLAASLAFDGDLRGTDTRLVAKSWIEANVPAGTTIAVENYGPPLVREGVVAHYREAGLDPVAYRLVRLQLPVPGTPDHARDLGSLRRRGVQYVLLSSRVGDRVRAAAADYPRIAAFYRTLEQQTTLVKEFRPGPGERGPVLSLYRIDARP